MELGISGRTALVTGGASGIGRAIVTDLAKEGVPVVFKSRNWKRGEQLLREILEIN
jgi:NAD(P)-dependent dehydrogenase (short-subunit alcohol dehydrogenase family)